MKEFDKITRDPLPDNAVFSLDIGTRSIIGMVGLVEQEKVRIVAIERAEHTGRAMVDGQIENIDQVATLAIQVKEKLEKKLNCTLDRVCVAAAGRALRTQKASYEIEMEDVTAIDEELISQLEAGAIGQAEASFEEENQENSRRQFFLVGYTVSQYYLDNYPISTLKDHHGRKLKADIIATFLPSEVVESLYTSMHKIGLEVASMTLEPIAAINAAIPQNLRLLNLALVDIGAGTSDIAACRAGSVIGYTMATVAGDEITESIMQEYLVDFQTAERIKSQLSLQEEISFTDVLGFDQTVTRDKVLDCTKDAFRHLCEEISEKILEVNAGPPSAVFLAGGGSQLAGLLEGITECLKMDPKRVAIAGNNFQLSAYSDEYDLNNPEYATPLGIAVSAGLNLINDSFRVMLNDKPAKLFRNGAFTVRDILMMNGYTYQDMLGRSGQNLVVTVNGERVAFRGQPAEPAVLKVNGVDGKGSDVVHAGDSIFFEPACNGADASALLSDLTQIPKGATVMLNGSTPDEDAPLSNGDVIEYDDISIAVPFLKETETAEKKKKAPDRTVPPHEPAFMPETQTKQTYPMPQTSFAQEPLPSGPKTENRNGLQADTLSDMAAPPDTASANGLSLQLNGKNLTLPYKKDRTPYYLMDMLQYSGLDFTHITGQVVLEVNGKPGTFQQALKTGDRISIHEEPSKKI